MQAAATSAEAVVEYVPHPMAKMMPDLTDAKYQALKAGIRDHGLQHPIKVLKGTTFLLDGRHRLRACRELGIEPKVDEVAISEEEVAIYTGAEAAKREGLNTTEKVLLAIELLPEIKRAAAERKYQGAAVRYGEKGKAAKLVASLIGVGSRSVEFGVALQKDHPQLFERVRNGELDLAEANRELAGRAAKSKSSKPTSDECWRVPAPLRDRLLTARDAVGGDTLGDGLEALLDFIEGDGHATWSQWAEARKTGPAI